MKRSLCVVSIALIAVWIALGVAGQSAMARPPETPMIEPETSITTAITRTPLIFIPGIQGSRLFNTVDGEQREVWLKWTNILPILENHLDVLRLAADGESPLYPSDPAYTSVHALSGSAGLLTSLVIDLRDLYIPWPEPVFEMKVYAQILSYFKSRGYSETVDFWVYPYDWRKDLRQSANGLDALVNQIMSQTGQSQVYIVAHSMGGLVARTYISDTARAAKVKRLMTLGTPYLGTPTAPQVLLEGSCLKGLLSLDLRPIVPFRLCLPSTDKSKSLVPNLPGFYTLFPSRSYFTVKGGGYYGMPDAPNPSGACPSCLNFTQTYTSAVLPPLNASIFQRVDNLHSLIDARPGDTWHGVPVDIVVGNGQPTVAGIQPQKRVGLKWPFYYTVYVPVQDKYGDGTVALFSASMSNVVNGVNLRGTATYKEFVAEHVGLTQDCLVWGYIDQQFGLSGADPCSLPTARRSAAEVSISPTAQIVAFNAASIEAVDAQGRRTGPLTTTTAIELGIPGSAYDPGEAQSLTLWGGVPYTITIHPSGQGAVDVMTWQNTLSDTITTTYHAGLSVTAQSSIVLNGDPFLTDAWQIDLDGNGVPETTPPLTSVYGDGVAQDHSAPTTTISIDGVIGPQGWYTQPVTVTLTANDEVGGTGLSRIEYFFSNERVMRPYTGPFLADPAGGRLYAFATDQAINQHEPVTARIGPDITCVAVDGVLHVPTDCDTIQAAINAAQPGDEIRIQDGDYYEHLVITKSLQLTGGWNFDYTEQGADLTVVDAGATGRGLTVLTGTLAPSVVISNFVFKRGDATGLGGAITPTIYSAPPISQTASRAVDTRPLAMQTAGLRANLAQLAAQGNFPGGAAEYDRWLARIDELTALSSAAQSINIPSAPGVDDELDCGGGIYVRGASLRLIKVYVNVSTASRTGAGAGGGLCAVDVPANGLVFNAVSMNGNTASLAGPGYGGALFFTASDPVSGSLRMTDVAFRDNTASMTDNGYGGALFLSGAPAARFNLAVLTANTATRNGLSGFGGALYLVDSGGVTLNMAAFQLNNANVNQVVVDPTTDWLTGLGGAIYANNTPDLTLTSGPDADDPRSILVGNVAALTGLGRGGGLYAENVPGLRVERTTFLNNWGAVYVTGVGDVVGGGAIYLIGAPRATLTDNDFNNNVAGVLSLEGFKLLGGAVSIAAGSDQSVISANRFRENVGGTAAQGGDASGGAIDIGYNEVITVTDNTFTGNVADLGPSGGLGGALHVKLSNDVVIHHNTFERNRAGTGAGIGGALTLEGASAETGLSGFTSPRGLTDTLINRVTISANTFRDNRAAVNLDSDQVLLGGAVAFNGLNGVTLVNNIIANNVAKIGAGLALLGWDVERIAHDAVRDAALVNNTLVGNAGENGVYLEMWTTPITLTNNIIVSHTVGVFANTNPTLGGMTVEMGYTVYNDNLTNSEAAPDSVLTDTQAITEPVQFVDRLQNNYRLQFTSPARDAGDPAGVPPAPAQDADGQARPVGPRVDIGAYEWHGLRLFLPIIQKAACTIPAVTGWALGEQVDGPRAIGTVIMRTTDGGLSWTRQYTSPIPLYGLAVGDAQHVWVTGDQRTILRTSNGGQSWVTQTVPITLPANLMLKVTAVDANTAWVIANTAQGTGFYIIHTSNGGATWVIQKEVQYAVGVASWIDAADAQNAWVVGGYSLSLANGPVAAGKMGFIYHTNNGGQTWDLQLETPDAPVQQLLIGVDAVSANVAWAAGREGVYRTLDGGANWTYWRSWGGAADANHVDSVEGGNRVWVSGDRFVVQYTDKGLSPTLSVADWQDRNPTELYGKVAYKLDFIDAQTGWIAGGNFGTNPDGVLARTCNAGLSWQWTTWPEFDPIRNVAMIHSAP